MTGKRIASARRGRVRCGYVERLIGSIRHECLDHLMVFNAEDFRRILAKYYNEVRTHVSLGKDTPCTGPIERFGDVVAYPILGGLHHPHESKISEATSKPNKSPKAKKKAPRQRG